MDSTSSFTGSRRRGGRTAGTIGTTAIATRAPGIRVMPAEGMRGPPGVPYGLLPNEADAGHATSLARPRLGVVGHSAARRRRCPTNVQGPRARALRSKSDKLTTAREDEDHTMSSQRSINLPELS